MADKYRRTQPLNITFADGEQPDAGKLSAITKQDRAGSRLLEKAVGDVWNQSGDAQLYAYPLGIPNLARMIGQAKYLGSATSILPYTISAIQISECTGKWVGQNQGFLTFAPLTLGANPASGSFTTLKGTEALVLASGDYWVDITTGRFKTARTITGTDATIVYSVIPSAMKHIPNLAPTLIPDPRQTHFTGCKIWQNSGSGPYLLSLPPRQPLTGTTDWPLPVKGFTIAADIAANQSSADNITTLQLWQQYASTSTLAFTGTGTGYYRYQLPADLVTMLAAMNPGDAIAEGYLYLWNKYNNTIVEDVVFKKPSLLASTNTWTLEISSNTLNLASLCSSDETANSYNTNYGLILPGASISRNIEALWDVLLDHTHDNTDLIGVVSHNNLSNSHPEAWHTVGSFSGTWVSIGGATYHPPQYRLTPEGKVELRGHIKSGSLNTSAFTLPYIPTLTETFTTSSAAGVAYIKIETSGNVTPVTGTTTDISLDGIAFWTD